MAHHQNGSWLVTADISTARSRGRFIQIVPNDDALVAFRPPTVPATSLTSSGQATAVVDAGDPEAHLQRRWRTR
jgi:hypothetical protein